MVTSFGDHDTQPDPSARFLTVAREVAEAYGFDPHVAAAGGPLEHEGLIFSLRQHGELDPSGLIVAIETDPLVRGMEAQQCKSLLRQQLRMPPAFGGYYALAPHEDVVLFCFRVDLDKDRRPALMVQTLLEKVLEQRQQIARMFVHELPRELEASAC